MSLPADSAAVRARIEAFALDHPDDAAPFSRRLRRETGWSERRAARVIAEYRRFLVLAMTQDHPVSPSPAVDVVWHLHLTDTRRYWDDFCPHVLGRPLHHEPSRGGAAERRRHDDQYQRTLAAYARVFGASPPRDIWPRKGPAGAAPARQALFALVRALGAGPRTALVAAGTAATALLVAGCAALYDSSTPGAIQGPDFIKGYFLAAVAAVFVILALQALLAPRPRSAGVRAADLGAYEIAYLAGGPQRVMWTAVLRLRQGGYLRRNRDVRRPLLSPGDPLPPGASPLEVAVVRAAAADRLPKLDAVGPEMAMLKDKLAAAGLIPADGPRKGRWIAPLAVMGPLMLLGLVRLYYGQQGHRAVGFLLVALVLEALTMVALARRPTGLGADARAVVKVARKALPRRRAAEGDGQLARLVALYGLTALGWGAFADTRPVLARITPPGGGADGSGCSGGGSSCGGGGCGGGCGG